MDVDLFNFHQFSIDLHTFFDEPNYYVFHEHCCSEWLRTKIQEGMDIRGIEACTYITRHYRNLSINQTTSLLSSDFVYVVGAGTFILISKHGKKMKTHKISPDEYAFIVTHIPTEELSALRVVHGNISVHYHGCSSNVIPIIAKLPIVNIYKIPQNPLV